MLRLQLIAYTAICHDVVDDKGQAHSGPLNFSEESYIWRSLQSAWD